MSELKQADSPQKPAYDPAMQDKLSLKEKFCYGLGDVSGNMVNLGVNMYYNTFLTTVAGLNATTVGIIQMLSRIFDGISDIISGLLTDRTHTKYGKCRPWLLWMAIPYAICLALMFWSPNTGTSLKVLYAFITYNLVITGTFTFTQTPYGALSARMTQDKQQRDMLNIWRMVPQVLCSFVVGSFTPDIIKFFGGTMGTNVMNQRGFLLTFLVYGIVSAVTLYLTFAGTKERVPDEVPATPAKKREKTDWASIKALFRNKYWVIQLLSNVIQALDTISGGVMMYSLMYIMKDVTLTRYMGFGSIIMAVSLFFVAPFALKLIGKRWMALSHFAVGALFSLLLLLNPDSAPVFIVMNLVKPFFAVGNASTKYSMLADAADYGEWKTGVRNEGLIFAGASFGNKVGQGVASGISLVALGLAGYISSTDGALVTQPQSALTMLVILFCLTPLILNLLGVVLMSMWDLDKKYDQIAADLAVRRAANK